MFGVYHILHNFKIMKPAKNKNSHDYGISVYVNRTKANKKNQAFYLRLLELIANNIFSLI